MRRTERNTERHRLQRGQAIVLIALMMLVLLGMVGLAIDGGRAYVDRRQIQDAVDAAALAAGDNFSNTRSINSAESAGAYVFAENERILGAASWTGLGTDAASVTWPDYAGSVNVTVTHNAFNGTNFQYTTSHALGLSFMQVLGVGSPISTATSAKTVVLSQSQTPALLTLSQSGCPGATGTSLSISGSANVAIVGALYSNGSIAANSGGSNITVAGNAFDQCGAVPNSVTLVCYNPNTNPPSADGAPPCPAGDILGQAYSPAPPLPDPGYVGPPPALIPGNAQPAPGSTVELQPGNYSNFKLTGSSSCYFLDPGVYYFSGGLSMTGGLVSNELRAPAEAASGNLSAVATPQVWHGAGNNVVNCNGDYEVAAVTSSNGGGKPIANGEGPVTWAVFVTSVRTGDGWSGTTYYRESAPSVCRTVTMDGHAQGFQLAISNVPGAQAYNIYANPGGSCTGTFGYVGQVSQPISESNSAASGCPYLPPVANPIGSPGGSVNGACSLGYVVSPVFDAGNLAQPYQVDSSGSFCAVGGPPSAWCRFPTASLTVPGNNDGGEGPAANGAPQGSPIRDIQANGGGDRANENECRVQAAGASGGSPCLGASVTPGAVQFYFPPSQCLDVEGAPGSGKFGDLLVFGGIQYRGIVFYAPAGNTCSLMKLAGGSATTVIGTIYMPGATFNVRGGAQTAVSGQVIVGSAAIDGTSGTAITYNPGLSPPAPGARLII